MKNTRESLDGSTELDDYSGLKLPADKTYKLEEIYVYEAKNIAKATIKYLSAPPSRKIAPFSYTWMLELHREMFGDVWEWAGKLRQIELSIGIKAYLVSTELKKLVDDIGYWTQYHTYDTIEIASRIHHRAVLIHPFQNGNGRWSRILANIYLRQHGLMPVKWQEDALAKENPQRNSYIEALKKADNGEYTALITLHKNLYKENSK